MIKLDLLLFAGIFVTSLVVLFLYAWVVFFLKGQKRSMGVVPKTDVRQCPYCNHVFVPQGKRRPVICPVCKSYLDEVDDEE